LKPIQVAAEQPASAGPHLVVANVPDKGVALVLHFFGPTTLVAIRPDVGGAHGFWLDDATLPQASEWAAEQNRAGNNLYFTGNQPRTGMNKKPAKSDIVTLRAIGADVDAKDGRTMDEALAAIHALPLRPSLVIMSGGGWQPFWFLAAPIEATTEAVRRAEAIGKRVAELTGGDAVQDVSRIFRLPFTVNWPNAKKWAARRVPTPSLLKVPSFRLGDR
jgi:hypothetical protein